jgi:hypothetical protein
MQYGFGAGVLWGVPTIDITGAVIANPTPVPFGALQDISLDFSWTMKELYGQYQMPLAVGRGAAKVTGKAKAARISASLFNLTFGETPVAGQLVAALDEKQTTALDAATVTHAATFVQDLGVSYAATGDPLACGAAPARGVYTVANGVYAFDPLDNGIAMKISYSYTIAATGQKFTINNQLLGACPFFKLVMNESYQGKVLHVELNRVISGKLSLATKLEDFMIPEFDFGIMVDDSNVVGSISVAEPGAEPTAGTGPT